MLVFQLISTAKLLPQANFFNFEIFVRKTLFLFWKSLKFELLRTVTISVDSTASLLPLLFQKTSVFLEKPKYSLILPNPKIWTFWETLLILSHCTAILLPSAIFENFKVFFRKTHLFCKKHSFWTLWEISLFRSHSTSKWLTVSVAVDIKLAKLSCFQKFKFLFRKNNYFRIQFVEKSYWLLRFWGNFATFIHLTKQLKIFSRETHLFLRKTNFQRFEKSYCFSLIQQQNWYL